MEAKHPVQRHRVPIRVVYLSPNADFSSYGGEFSCPIHPCTHHRRFGTAKGFGNGLVSHLLAEHNIQIIFGVPPAEAKVRKLSDLRNEFRQVQG